MLEFDHKIIDRNENIRIDVSRDAADFLLLSIQPASDPWPCTRLPLSIEAAAELAHALLAAVAETSETEAY